MKSDGGIVDLKAASCGRQEDEDTAEIGSGMRMNKGKEGTFQSQTKFHLRRPRLKSRGGEDQGLRKRFAPCGGEQVGCRQRRQGWTR